MNAEMLLKELGDKLGFELKLSEHGTCAVLFDRDEVAFEKSGYHLFLIADLAYASDVREHVLCRFLEANHLGQEVGLGAIGLDKTRNMYVLHKILTGDMPYDVFEDELSMFVKAVRYWKEWLRQPDAEPRNTLQDISSMRV